MLPYYPQYPTTPTYSRKRDGSLSCPPGSMAQPMYPGRPNSPVRCMVTNAMEHAEWVVTDTEPVPTDDIGPIAGLGSSPFDPRRKKALLKSSTLPTVLLMLGLFATLGVVVYGRVR